MYETSAWRVLAEVRGFLLLGLQLGSGKSCAGNLLPGQLGACGGPGAAVLSRGSLTVSSSALQAEVAEGNAAVCLSVCLLRCERHTRAASVQGLWADICSWQQ